MAKTRKPTLCVICREILPISSSMGWLTLIGIMAGIWRGHIFMPGGYAHRQCFEAYAKTVPWRAGKAPGG